MPHEFLVLISGSAQHHRIDLCQQLHTALSFNYQKPTLLRGLKMSSRFTIGFTGTRNGMTEHQRRNVFMSVAHILAHKDLVCAVHGDCEGADTDFHDINIVLKASVAEGRHTIKIRPCNHSSRAFNKGADITSPVKGPLDRNLDIISDCDVLIACPPTMEEIRRSGTWHTIRHARLAEKPIVIVWPDGALTREG